MHSHSPRRTALKVKDGRVQRKNRSTLSTHQRIVIMRRSPGRGFRHVVTKEDLQAFLDIIPGWEKYSAGLERIVLVCGDGDEDGYYHFWHREETGGIYLCAWPENLWVTWERAHFEYHPQLAVLGVAVESKGDTVECHFSEAQARAFLLLHVFMHELGHHWHAVKRRHHSTKLDEHYAETFANTRWPELHAAYVRVFGDPARAQAAKTGGRAGSR